MIQRQSCVYCGRHITTRSREHIIQNALGGLYESEDICCPECNNYISRYIDVPFTKTFNPIISRIENFTKTNNKKSHPVCSGKASYQGALYDVLIKDGKIVSCPTLSKKLKCDISKLPMEIFAYDFPIENNTFISGICKIAFNFALDKGIDSNILSHGVTVSSKEGVIDNISFKYTVIPFVPLNTLDTHIELNTSMELYHNLILFNQENMLWCYVDLFNTFQYYVLLSDNWNEEISVHETYLQLLQKIDKTIPMIILIIFVSFGVGAFLSIALVRIVLQVNLNLVLFIMYFVLFLVATFVPIDKVIGKMSEITAILKEAPSFSESVEMLSEIGLSYDEFEKFYGTEKIKDAVLYAKDLKDRYTVLWCYYDMFGADGKVF